MKQYFNKIIVLGAGFSKSFSPDIPTINDLSDILFDKNYNSEFRELKEYCAEFYGKCNSLKYYKDIEKISTSILSKRIFNNYNEKLQNELLKNQLLDFIYKEISKHEIEDKNSSGILSKFISSNSIQDDLSPNKNTIISFNYDVLIEKQFIKDIALLTSCFMDYDVNLSNPDGKENFKNRVNKFSLLKLHGSFNWYNIKGSSNIDINSIFLINPWQDSAKIYEDDIPIYIPMAHTKDSFLTGNLFNTIWSKAYYYLKYSKEIIFIGYGFPITDVNNLMFFLQFKEKIKDIIVYYDNNDDKEFKRIKRIFGKDKVKNLDAKEYIEGEDFSPDTPMKKFI